MRRGVRHIPVMRNRDVADPEQLDVLRRLSPAQRYQVSRDLYWTLRKHKRHFLAELHPEWSEDRIDAEVRRIFLNARS